MIGTAGDHGQVYPGAEIPFGTIKLGPDTAPGAVTGTAHAGYDYNDGRILGFSHLRFSGVGNRGVGGNLLLLPGRRREDLLPGDRGLPFRKSSENCSPGYYAVTFEDSGIRAELTATLHVGVHRYSFSGKGPIFLRIDLGRSFTRVRDAHAWAVDRQTLQGEIVTEQMSSMGWYRSFFTLRLSRPFRELSWFTEGGKDPSFASSGQDGQLAAIVSVPGDHEGEPLIVQVGWSFMSPSDAFSVLKEETEGQDFEVLSSRCRTAWESVLQRIELEGDCEEDQILFYSHLYRAHLSPFHITNSEGRFMGDDGQVHEAQGYTHYNGWSIWDTYCTKFPLLAMTQPTLMRDFMTSLTHTLGERLQKLEGQSFFDNHGFSPLPTVRYEMSNTVFLDAHLKGCGSQDPNRTFDVIRAVAEREFPEAWQRLGYVPGRPDKTCEYAYDQWAVAEMARALGRPEEGEPFEQRARYFLNVWDPALRFFRARDERGDWLDFPEDPTEVNEKYVYEGSMWHWRWCVVHDIAEMIRRMGGKDTFIRELNAFFERDLHNHGNEPGIHAPWLFVAAGAPWLSQKWVRTILSEPMLQKYGTHGRLEQPYYGRIYSNQPEGFIPEMDDDDGCMTSWYVLSSMGLFPLCVGRPLYAVGCPLFRKVTLRQENGRSFECAVRNAGEGNKYVQSATLNGEPLESPWLRHQDLLEGGVLELEVGPDPNVSWGR